MDIRMLDPPLSPARPTAAHTIPGADATGRWQFSTKLDGIRGLLYRYEDRVRLRSRRDNELSSEFPELCEAGAALGPNSIIDGEIVSWRGGRFEFTDLLRTRSARRASGAVTGFIVFDALCVDDRDLRGEPLTVRWGQLERALAAAAPPLQLIMATSDHAEAEAWMSVLPELGVEGVVARRWDSPYRSGTASGWTKIRTFDTVDAQAIALFGPAHRPTAALVRLPDGTATVTSPALTPSQSRYLGELAAQLVSPGPGRRHDLAVPLPVELRVGHGRHARAAFLRVRRDD